MKKRRRLANKMTIMVSAVLIAVSAFFYIPMEAHAKSVVSVVPEVLEDDNVFPDVMPLSLNTGIETYSRYYGYYSAQDSTSFNFAPYLKDGAGIYKVKLSFREKVSINVSSPTTYYRNIHAVMMIGASGDYTKYNVSNGNSADLTTDDFYVYVDSAKPNMVVYHRGSMVWGSQPSSPTVTCTYTVSNVVATKISGDEETAYNNGYNAGYSAGEDAGYDSGYSNGYNAGYSAGQDSDSYQKGFEDGKNSVDTDSYYQSGYEAGENAGYNSGYDAGVDSVDTQSYYDAGYQAGYQKAYDLGYDTGYDAAYDIAYNAGYDAAMAKVEKWGADTSEYPIRLVSGNGPSTFSFIVKSSQPLRYEDSAEWTFTDIVLNPNHTYKFRVNTGSYTVTDSDAFTLEDDFFYLEVGGISYKLSTFSGSDVNEFFIPGDRMSNAFSISWKPYASMYGDDVTSDSITCKFTYNFAIYDMGPSGDTQNHIANQTDNLTNGYDSSQGNKVNSDLSSGLNEYQTAEDSLWATATNGMKDFTFFDIDSVPAMVTGISFVTATMTGWFNNAGGASGVGIVLSILFSVMLVAMVLGLYRWYQSKGGKG